mmetsp:Transcript_68887/g.222669  ORF Transcript_68887/g.222669 Transcript_68887/m.222669 type:complete len:360 (+) Transcript_68887:88-1167(+)
MHHQVPCIIVAITTFLVILAVLSRHGYLVQLSACVYIISLTATQLLMAELTNRPFEYRFPAWVTVLHFISCWIFCLLYWLVSGDFNKCSPRSLSLRRYTINIVPITLTLPIGVACNNMALMYMAPGLTAIISALSPVVTAVLSILFGRAMHRVAILGLLVALLGAVIISLSEVRFGVGRQGASVAGLCFALAAVALRALKSVLQDRLLNASEYMREEEKPLAKDQQSITPMHMWAVQSPPMILVAVAYAACTESLTKAVHQLTVHNVCLMLVTCVSATALNILGATTIKALGASLMQAIGKLNMVFTVAFSVAFLGEQLPVKVLIGACVMLAGVIIYEKADSWSRFNASCKETAKAPKV